MNRENLCSQRFLYVSMNVPDEKNYKKGWRKICF